MYLHLGQNVIIPTKNIVGIFDLNNTTVSKKTREYLNRAEKNGHIIYVNRDLPRSFVVCEYDGVLTVYVTQLASTTLYKRTQSSFFENIDKI